ncbi:hypothetical protein PENANT_c003G07837 [Penicillium antarcticum]|uniref:Uncharacterized protein n=1 Tax=Penicillium antarcticum TaxID=416450 RepID=A0A1V6QJM2_9EURO|nr:hypothetical protein PENANT_c003G07837 [Penicillium antarcticum]
MTLGAAFNSILLGDGYQASDEYSRYQNIYLLKVAGDWDEEICTINP